MTLLSQQQFSDLVASVYDCALDAALWPSVLERLGHSIDAVHGAVRVVDPRTRHLRLNINWGADAHWTDLGARQSG